VPSSLECSRVRVLSYSCCRPQGSSEVGVRTPTSVPAGSNPVPGSTGVSVLLAVRVGYGGEMMCEVGDILCQMAFMEGDVGSLLCLGVLLLVLLVAGGMVFGFGRDEF